MTVFCLVDDTLKESGCTKKPHVTCVNGGPMPQLSDSELLTIEIVGEFKGIDTDKELFAFVRREYGEWFPALRHIHRTTFVRQAANLWAVKVRLREAIYRHVNTDALLSIIDSFPIPVCRFARAKRCRRLREVSAYGYDPVAQQTFFGIKGHLVIELPGVIADFRLPPGNVSDVEIADDLLAERETQRYPKELTRMRYRIDTLIGQLVERFHFTKIRARDWWHQRSRWLRKVLSHTVAVLLCQRNGLSPLSEMNWSSIETRTWG